MSEEKNSSTPTQQQTSTEPNKDVPPPQITFVLDHAAPQMEKGQQKLNESNTRNSEK